MADSIAHQASLRIGSSIISTSQDARLNFSPPLVANNAQLPFVRITSASPRREIGKDIAFLGIADTGETYWLKEDGRSSMVRGTEMFCYQIARSLGFDVPDCAIAHYREETYFASRDDCSTDRRGRTEAVLNRRAMGPEGIPSLWPGTDLEQIYGLDMLLGNPDRQTCNFLAGREQLRQVLYLIDFADVRLAQLGGHTFPASDSATRIVWRRHRAIHELGTRGVLQTADRLRQVSRPRVVSMLEGIPDEWMAPVIKEQIEGLWSSDAVARRISAFVAGVNDGTLV